MSLLSSVLGAVTGKTDGNVDATPLVAMLSALLAQSGGLQGLMNKFSQAGLGHVFSDWVSTGPNPPVSPDQVRQVLGPDQIQNIAAQLGIDPGRASELVAEFLPTVVDRLTPGGKIDPATSTHEGLAGVLPSLLANLTSSTGRSAPA
jgi:uncharacterized protein YidB (DUF937 family)